MKFDIGDLHVMWLSSCNFFNIQCSEGQTLLQGVKEILPVFSIYLSELDKIRYRILEPGSNQ
jgi:hypothetical protein